MTVSTVTRNANLQDMVDLLDAQQRDKLDLVVPATAMRMRDGQWVVKDAATEPDITAEGDLVMRSMPGTFRPTVVADDQTADKLGIPSRYLRKLRAERVDLLDANVNGWLHGRRKVAADGSSITVYDADERKFLLRTFRGSDGEPGVLRAILSDRFKTIDNLDVLVAALAGVREAGVEISVDGCDLSDNRMYVRISAPQVAAMAPVLLENYRSPFGGGIERVRDMAAREGMGYDPGTEPVVFAGLVIGNSETGGGAFIITPRLEVRICKNGLTIRADAMREVHLGGKLEEGVVSWSNETQDKALELITAKAKDAVATFLNPQYLEAKIAEFTAKATKPVTDPAEAVKVVTTRLKLSEAIGRDVLTHFIKGGQMTVGGIAQAVSSVAQTVENADQADDLEAQAVQVLDMAAALS